MAIYDLLPSVAFGKVDAFSAGVVTFNAGAWTPAAYVNLYIYFPLDGTAARITANTATTVSFAADTPSIGQNFEIRPAASVPAGGLPTLITLAASQVVVTPVGNIASTDAQAALAELDAEKVAIAGDTMTGSLILNADPVAALGAVTLQLLESRLAGLLMYRGAYDAITNTPDLDVAPIGILVGYSYTVSVAGTFFTATVEIGDMLIAEQDNPTLESHWTIIQANVDHSIFTQKTSSTGAAIIPNGTTAQQDAPAAGKYYLRYNDTVPQWEASADGGAYAALGGGGGGKIGQVVQAVEGGVVFSSTATTLTAVGAGAIITPSATTSKVLVEITCCVSANAALQLVTSILRGTTSLTPTGDNGFADLFITSASDSKTMTLSYLDSPATTSATTYKLGWYSSGGTIFIGRRGDSTAWNKAPIVVTLKEILA